jgi:hypothetical protein
MKHSRAGVTKLSIFEIFPMFNLLNKRCNLTVCITELTFGNYAFAGRIYVHLCFAFGSQRAWGDVVVNRLRY